jgi:membrane fusion protein (multidrug efflux system)
VALVRNGDHTFVWRVQGGILKKVEVVLGERDARRGDFALRSGLADGDQVVRNPPSTLKDGAKVEPLATANTVKKGN